MDGRQEETNATVAEEDDGKLRPPKENQTSASSLSEELWGVTVWIMKS